MKKTKRYSIYAGVVILAAIGTINHSTKDVSRSVVTEAHRMIYRNGGAFAVRSLSTATSDERAEIAHMVIENAYEDRYGDTEAPFLNAIQRPFFEFQVRRGLFKVNGSPYDM